MVKKLKVSKIFTYVFLAVAVAAVIISISMDFCADETTNVLAKNTIPRVATGLFLLALLISGKQLQSDFSHFGKKVLWCLPCLLTVVANFPFGALAHETATLNKTNLLWLFALECFSVGLMEELFFREIAHNFVKGKLSSKRNGYFWSVVTSSALFAVWHLLNLLDGAGVGATLLQTGYSFLIGAMLAVTLDKTNNVWICVVLHTLFNFGGNVVETLGQGTPWDVSFWVATALCGTICCVHVVLEICKKTREQNLNLQKENTAR